MGQPLRDPRKAWNDPKLDDRGRRRDGDLAARRLEEIGGAVHELSERGLNIWQPRLSLCRQGDAASPPIEQLRAEPQFEVPDALAYGRLGEPELVPGRREAAEPRRGFEDPDPFERWQGLMRMISHNQINAILPIFIAGAYGARRIKCREHHRVVPGRQKCGKRPELKS